MKVSSAQVPTSTGSRKPFYTKLWVQVVFGMGLAIIFGYIRPERAIAMKPLGDAFIHLISMIISLIIFCTVVSGIAGMQDLKKVGRVGGKALLYFEIVSTFALLLGLAVGNFVRPGDGFNANPATLDTKAVSDYAGQAKGQSVTDFVLHIIPSTVVDAFAKGDILQVLLVSLLFGFALASMGPRGKPLVDLCNALSHAVFGVINILMRFAPIGAFGAPSLLRQFLIVQAKPCFQSLPFGDIARHGFDRCQPSFVVAHEQAARSDLLRRHVRIGRLSRGKDFEQNCGDEYPGYPGRDELLDGVKDHFLCEAGVDGSRAQYHFESDEGGRDRGG